MLPDLDRVIRLQKLETAAEEARRTIADQPQRLLALERRLEEAKAAVASVRQRVTDSQTVRRNEEKDLAAVQGRLTKYKDQLLEVKTNREYQAMQHEIAAAQTEVSRHEDRILERMLELDELNREVKQAESALTKVQNEVATERAAIEEQARQLEAELSKSATARAALVAEISPPVVATFDNVARGRKGVAVAEAREGHCTLCHVRLRPQVFNEIRRNDSIIQCDSCQRILYFAGSPAGPSAGASAPPTETAGAS
ncbi:MAG TPA: C4-type zinc ribbon domain-containing protein [Vicinamibacterales bacterium]